MKSGRNASEKYIVYSMKEKNQEDEKNIEKKIV